MDTDGVIAASVTLIHGIIRIIGVIHTTVTILTLTGTGIILIGEVMDTATIMGTGAGTTEISGTIIMDKEGRLLPPMEEETPGPIQVPPNQNQDKLKTQEPLIPVSSSVQMIKPVQAGLMSTALLPISSVTYIPVHAHRRIHG